MSLLLLLSYTQRNTAVRVARASMLKCLRGLEFCEPVQVREHEHKERAGCSADSARLKYLLSENQCIQKYVLQVSASESALHLFY